MSDVDVQAVYDELNKRGVFKDPEKAAIGHELRRRGVVKDPTQGGAVVSQTPAPVSTPAVQRPAPAKPAAPPPVDPAHERAIADYSKKYFSDQNDKNTPNLLLAKIKTIPGTEARRAALERLAPKLSEVGKMAILRKAYEHSGSGTGSIGPAPAGAPPSLVERALAPVNNALSTPKAALNAAVQPLEFSADQKYGGARATGDPAIDAATDFSERQRIARLPFRQRMEALRGQPTNALAQPHKAATDSAALSHANRVGRIGGKLTGMGAEMLTDPLTWATLGTGSIAEGAAAKLARVGAREGLPAAVSTAAKVGAKAAKAAPRAVSGVFATQQLSSAVPTIMQGVREHDEGKVAEGIVSAVFGAMAGAHASGLPEALEGRRTETLRRAEKAKRTDAISRVNLKEDANAKPPQREAFKPAPNPQAKPEEAKPVETAKTTEGVKKKIVSEAEAARQRVAARKQAASVPNSEPNVPEIKMAKTDTVSPDKIGVKEGMQYKREGITDPENAVSDILKGTGTYDVDQGGRLTIWRDNDGNDWVVNGHHRLELAKRADRFVKIGPEGNAVDVPREVPVSVLHESEGWTKDRARARGALENIRDNKGTALDAVEVVRGLGIKPEDFSKNGISTTGEVARNMRGLLSLDEEALNRVKARDITEQTAAGIGSVEGLDPSTQRGAIDEAAQKNVNSYSQGRRLAEIYLEDQKSGTLADSGGGQIDLFGGELNANRSTRAERVALEEAVRLRLAADRRALLKPTGVELGEGEHIDEAGRKQKAAGMAESNAALTERMKLLVRQDSVREEIARLAREMGNGKLTKQQATEQLAAKLKPHIGRSVRELTDPGGVSLDSGHDTTGQPEPAPQETNPTGASDLFAQSDQPEAVKSQGAGEKIKAAAESQAEKAKARIAKRKKQGGQSLGSMGGKAVSDFIENAADYAVIGAAHIASGLVDFGAWSGEMVKEFGDEIKEHLPALWKASQSSHQELTEKFTKPAPKPKPEPPKRSAPAPAPGGDYDTTPLPAKHENQTKIANAHVEEQRALFGTRALPDAVRRSHEAVVDHVLSTGMHVDAMRVAQEVLRKDRAMSPEEVVANNLRQHQIKDEVIKLRKQIQAAAEKGQDITALKIAHNALMEDYTLLGDADRRAGTITSQALGIRKAVVDDYTYPNIVDQMRQADPKKPLTPQEEAKIADVDARLREVERREAELEAKRKALDEKRSNEAAERAVKTMVAKRTRAARSGERADTRNKLDEQFQELQKRLVKATSQLNAGIDPSLVPILRDMARNRIEAGALKVADVVDAVHAAIEEHVEGVTKREVRDAISGYGQEATERPVSKLAEMKRQMALLSQIEDARAQVEKVTKRAPRPLDPETAALKGELKAVREANKPAPKPRAVASAETRLERYKEYLREMIEDYNTRIEEKDFTKKEPTPTLLDKEATELRAQRDALKDIYDSLDPGRQTRVLERRQKTAETLLQNQISELQRRIAEKDIATPAKRATPDNPNIARLKQERDTIRRQYQDMKEKLIESGGPEAKALQRARSEKAKQAALTRMQNRLDELNRKIAAGDATVNRRPASPDSPEKAALRAKLARAQREFNSLRERKADPVKLARRAAEARLLDIDKQLREEAQADIYAKNDPQAKQRVLDLQKEREDLFKEMQDMVAGPVAPLRDPLALHKKNMQKAIADLQKQISAGEPAPPKTRPKPVLDEEAAKLAEEKARLRREVDRMVKAREPKSVLDKYRVYHRFAILSRVGSLAKLSTAAAERILFSPIEELVGAPLSAAMPGVAAKAGIQGKFSMRAEMAALKVLTQRATYADALRKGKTGMNSLDALYGSKGDHDDAPSILDLPGRIHGLIKTPAQKAAFARASVKLDAWAKRQGLDTTDATVKAQLNARAYQESLRHILMNQNAATGLYRGILSGLGNSAKHPTAGRAVAAGMRALMPIVSVPTNFAGEVGLHMAGSVRAAAEVIAARGASNLTPEQADIVMRSLKKQGIGAALFAIGYFNADKIGGYYTPGQKRQEDGPEYGGMQLFGHNVPHLLLHSPAIEALTVGATFHKAMDAAEGKAGSDTLSSLGNGTWAAAQGIASGVPFFDLPARAGEAKQSADKTGRFLGSEAVSLAVPGIVPEVAGMVDRDANGKVIARRPRGFTDEVKMGLGMRRLVPSQDESTASRRKKVSLNPLRVSNPLHLPKLP